MNINPALFLVMAASVALLIYPMDSASQTAGDGTGAPTVPGGLIPDDDTPGPVANTGAEHKFDGGFYQKILDLAQEAPRDGDPGVYDGTRYYNVLIVVSRDDGDDRDPDETAGENKDAVVKRLELLGARDIRSAESLSFVTASIPVADVPGFSLHDEVYALGDGELPVTVEADRAMRTTHSTPSDLRLSVGSVPNGTGVVVGVVDSGINSIHLNGKVTDRIYCPDNTCSIRNGILTGQFTSTGNLARLNLNVATHGTQVAQVIAASEMPAHNGAASGVTLLDARYGDGHPGHFTYGSDFSTSLAHSVDWSYSRGADVINISAGLGNCARTDTTAYNLVLNEAVDKGMVAVKTAGNRGLVNGVVSYTSSNNPGCSHNVISVGGINDRNSVMTMANFASRGPTTNMEPRLVPHIVAPAVDIQTLNFTTSSVTHPRSGTSYAAPQVSATAAMMLQIEPELTPAEVKVALLLGANWTGPTPCTSAQYERNNARDNCSYARQPTVRADANNAASLGILNNVGFGILDAAKSLKYVHTLTSYVVSGYLDSGAASKQYRFTVTDTSKPVKVILTWMAHPHGGIQEQLNRAGTGVPIANLDFTVRSSDGTTVARANSAHQTTEFAVFDPPRTGVYTVTVSGSGLGTINKPVQVFALASTNPLTALPSSPQNHPPVAQLRTVVVSPGMETPVRLSATDGDGDAVSFRVSRDPVKGTVTTDELVTKTISRVMYTPNRAFTGTDIFQIIPHDGTTSGAAAVMTLRSESLPSGSVDAGANPALVRDWDAFEITTGFAHTDYSRTFTGKNYPVSSLYVGSVNMEGADLTLVTTGGARHTVAVPSSGDRMITFSSPITIRSATISADGIDEEAVQSAGSTSSSSALPDVRMFVGYVPSSCSASGTSGSSSSSCPATSTYGAVTQPNAAILDNADRQSTSSTINIPANGTLASLSVSVDITHTFKGDLKVVLTSPAGTQITLHDKTGGGIDNIKETYTSNFGTLVGSQISGDWTLSVGDYASGDRGVLGEWSIRTTYSPPAVAVQPQPPVSSSSTTVFSDDFESNSLTTKWTETGEGDWRTSTSPLHGVTVLPGHTPSNLVLHSDNCDTTCTLTLKNPIDLTAYSSATLSFWRFLDSSLDAGEYLKMDVYNGNTWNTVFDWSHDSRSDDHRWHFESYSLAPYLTTSSFNLRFVTHQSSIYEDVQIDDVTINATRGSTPTPPAPTPTPPAPTPTPPAPTPTPPAPTPTPPAPTPASDYTVYLADTDDREILAFSKDGTYQGAFVSSRSGGLGKAWDVAFGPDSNLYVSDNTNKKIREYNGTTGSPISSSSSGWASTVGYPYGLVWKGNTLYVATSTGVERFSSSGTSMGYFGDASRNPPTAGASRIGTAYDVAFCPNDRMYVADRSQSDILYYDSSTGAYLGKISGDGSPWPNTYRAAGLECGSAMGSSTATSLYQSGDDAGRVNEINPATNLPIRSITSSMDEPYGMDMDSAGILYVANKDDDNIVKISSGTTSVFASGNRMDDPRGLTVGTLYARSASGSSDSSSEQQDPQNDGPELEMTYANGTAARQPVLLAVGHPTATLYVRAADPEGDTVTITAMPDSLPASALTATDHGNGTATLFVNATGIDSGLYVFWINASDGHDNYEHEPYAIRIP